MTRHRLLIALIALLLLTPLLLVGCASSSKSDCVSPAATAPSAEAGPKPINKFCAVEQDNPVDDRVPTVMYNGKVIGFCCPDCIDTFKKNPEKYMATLK